MSCHATRICSLKMSHKPVEVTNHYSSKTYVFTWYTRCTQEHYVVHTQAC